MINKPDSLNSSLSSTSLIMGNPVNSSGITSDYSDTLGYHHCLLYLFSTIIIYTIINLHISLPRATTCDPSNKKTKSSLISAWAESAGPSLGPHQNPRWVSIKHVTRNNHHLYQFELQPHMLWLELISINYLHFKWSSTHINKQSLFINIRVNTKFIKHTCNILIIGGGSIIHRHLKCSTLRH